MVFLQIVVVLVFSVLLASIECGVVTPAVRYTQVAPLNVAPFAAQVNTYTRGLNVFAAPLAAGVAGPAIVARSLLPAPPAAPIAAPLAAPLGAPLIPAPQPVLPYAAGPVGPAVFPQAVAPAAPFLPVPQPAPLVAAPFARSIHAALPGFVPGVPQLAPAVPALTPALPSTTLLGWTFVSNKIEDYY